MSELRPLSESPVARQVPTSTVRAIAHTVDALAPEGGGPVGAGMEAFVEAALETLDGHGAAVLRLRLVQGRTLAETAARTSGCSAEAIRQHVRRALDGLARRFGPTARALLAGLDVALDSTGGGVAVHTLASLCGTPSVAHVVLCARLAGDSELQVFRGALLTRRPLGALEHELGRVRDTLLAEGLARQPWSRVAQCVADVAGLHLDRAGLARLLEAAHDWGTPVDDRDVVEVDPRRGARLASLLHEAGGPLTMEALCVRWRQRHEAFADDTASAERRQWRYRLSHALTAAISRRDDVWAVGPATYCHRAHLAFDAEAALELARDWLAPATHRPDREEARRAYDEVGARVPGMSPRAWRSALALAAAERGLGPARRGRS